MGEGADRVAGDVIGRLDRAVEVR
eukprot:SAG25_NODE_10585_length_328_cov_1.510917_2_plen_23_part_01